jgi:hypothetical protein
MKIRFLTNSACSVSKVRFSMSAGDPAWVVVAAIVFAWAPAPLLRDRATFCRMKRCEAGGGE